jgi:plastocyanin
MTMKTSLIALTALVAGAHLASAGDIVGKISLKGTPPPEKDLPLDPGCGKLHTTKPTTRFYVSEGGGLGDVYVTLKGVSGKSTGASAAPHAIDQKGCEYLPYVSAAQTGQKIAVKNSDPLLHNVHPTPTVAGNPEANKAQLPKGPDLIFTFNNAEEFLRFKCDVHPWMFSYVSIVDHPYFAVSAANGSYKISGVPDGKYTVVIKHRKAGTAEKEIEVKGGSVTADFELEAK